MGSSGRRTAQVVSRSLLRVRYFSLGNMPKSARRSALLVQIQAWAPFPESSYAVVWREQGALAFAWDRSLFLRRADAAGLPTEGVTVIPETLLLPCQAEGVTLNLCEAGCVGQYWQGGDPVHSRWWPEWPDAEAWLNFQRGVGIAHDAQLPLPPQPASPPAWLEQPWARPLDLDALRGQGRLWEHAAMGALALLLLAPTFWLARDWRESEAALESVNSRKTELESRVKPILEAREQAEAAIGTAQALADQIDHPDAMALLLHLSRVLPQDGSKVRELEWQGQQLRLSLSTPPSVQRSVYVKALESGQWLREVREAPESALGSFTVNAVIVGSREPAAMADAGPRPDARIPQPATLR